MPDFVPNRIPCGKKPEPQPIPPQPEPPKSICDMDGILYFKLNSGATGPENWIDYDQTKNCGLLGIEVDRNFYFLRAMDIKGGHTVVEDGRKYLVLERYGCDRDDRKIKIDITEDCEYGDPLFKVEDGHIYVKYYGGDEWFPFIDVETGLPAKFLTKVFTDISLNGDGTATNPLVIDPTYRTGTYMPADYFVDLTCEGVTIDDVPEAVGHNVVTKENAGLFGRLYTYPEVETLNELLDGGWRVPTREDWAKLLNSMENEDYAEHDTLDVGVFGCAAGTKLKTTNLWAEYEGDEKNAGGNGTDDIKFSVYPVGHDTDENIADDRGLADLYSASSFWSSTELNNSVYVRTFSYQHDDVGQLLSFKMAKRSLRLVRDITPDNKYFGTEYEQILGYYVPVVQAASGTQLWTSVNIGFTGPGYEGFVPEEWTSVVVNGVTRNMAVSPMFFYNAWTKDGWHKKPIREGETVSILYEDLESPCDTGVTVYVTEKNKNHEWKLFVNEETGEYELIDIFSEIYQMIEDDEEVTAAALNDLNDRVMTLEAHTIDGDESINVTKESNTTMIRVHIDDTDTETATTIVNGGQTRLGSNGIYFDGDFKLDSDQDDE